MMYLYATLCLVFQIFIVQVIIKHNMILFIIKSRNPKKNLFNTEVLELRSSSYSEVSQAKINPSRGLCNKH